MNHVVNPFPVATEIIRTPAAGPAPANTLAFLRCQGSGVDITLRGEDLDRFEIEFKSKFTIGGFLQQNHDWYLKNTLVSATGMIRLINSVDATEFMFALDTVDPFIDLDGVIGFNCQLGLQSGGVPIDFAFNVSAYVLLYEPPAKLPPSGSARQTWRHNPNEYVLQKIYSRGRMKSDGDKQGLMFGLEEFSAFRTQENREQSGRMNDQSGKDQTVKKRNNCD